MKKVKMVAIAAFVLAIGSAFTPRIFPTTHAQLVNNAEAIGSCALIECDGGTTACGYQIGFCGNNLKKVNKLP